MATVLIEATLCSLKQQSFETPNSNSELSKLLLKVLSNETIFCWYVRRTYPMVDRDILHIHIKMERSHRVAFIS